MTNNPGRLKSRRLACLLLALVLLPAPALAASAVTHLEARGSGGWRGVLELAASPLKTMRPTAMALTLYDPSGQPSTAQALSCALTMPAMPMPENRPQLVADGEVYRGQAIFTMAGAWQVEITIGPPEQPADKLLFAIDRVLLK